MWSGGLMFVGRRSLVDLKEVTARGWLWSRLVAVADALHP